MSYDFWIEADVGGGDPLCEDLYTAEGEYAANYTSNVSPMWSEALGRDMSDLRGMRCADAKPILDAAVLAMEADPARFRAMNPENGWGDYEGALKILRALADRCAKYPGAQIGMGY